MKFNTGDPHDDDANIIDENFQEVDEGPQPQALNMVPRETHARPAITDQLIGMTQTILTGGQPFPLLPADARRKSLTVHMVSNSTASGALSDVIYLADEPGKTATRMSAFSLTTTQTIDQLDYTGPVYAACPSTNVAASCDIYVLSVTK